MSKLFDVRILLAVACAATLAACGGGGGGEDDGGAADIPTPTEAPATDKYLGTWTVCTPEAGASTLYSLKIEKAATMGSYTYAERRDLFQANATCSGAADGYFEERGTAVPDPSGSATTVEGIAGDRVILTVTGSTGEHVTITNPNFGSYKQVVAITGGTSLHVGDRSSTADASGYPTKFLDTLYSKQ